MTFKQIILFYFLTFTISPTITAAVIAVDGASGFMGSSLVRELRNNDLHIGMRRAIDNYANKENVYVGNNFDPVYLKAFLKDVDIYYQMASIASVTPQHSLNQYILTNSVGPYLASRTNKTMSMLSLSSVAIYDVTQTPEIKAWIDKFVQHYSDIDSSLYTSQASVQNDLDNFMTNSQLPEIQPKQYYGLSKFLLEKLMEMSAKSREGHIYLIRPALIVGEDMRNRSGNNVLKDLMGAIFFSHKTYEIWNRLVYYTPSNNLKEMMLFVTKTNCSFANYEVFDSGWVPMQQHDFANKVFAAIKSTPPNIKLVPFSGFDRKVEIHEDIRVMQFYPKQEDVYQAIDDMVSKYQEMINQ